MDITVTRSIAYDYIVSGPSPLWDLPFYDTDVSAVDQIIISTNDLKVCLKRKQPLEPVVGSAQVVHTQLSNEALPDLEQQ